MRLPAWRAATLLAGLSLLSVSCSRAPSANAAARGHHPHPPHGGTPVVLGEAYDLELLLDASSGTLQAYVLDGEMENFVRSAAASLEIDATVGGVPHRLVLAAVPNPETGESVGDTSLFEGRADWLRGAVAFDGVVKGFSVRGTTYGSVKFDFPRGNDSD